MPDSTLERAVQKRLESDRLDRASEKRIEELSEETLALLTEYRELRGLLATALERNEQLEKEIAAQHRRMGVLQADASKIETIQQRFSPLLREMAETLREFVLLDLPFQHEQRLEKAEALLETVERGDLELPERFRSVMDAYRVEALHNKTIAAYPDTKLELQGRRVSVELLRVGRLMLYYRSPDGSLVGYWDRESRRWRPLPEAQWPTLKRALRVARREAAPELLPLPVPAVPRATAHR